MNKVSIRRLRTSLILLVDIFGIVLLLSLLYLLRFNRPPNLFTLELWLILISIVVTMFLSGTYFRDNRDSLPKLPIVTFFKSLLAIFPCIFIVYLLGPEKFNTYFGRGILPLGIGMFGIFATFNRYFFNRIYYWHEQNSDLLYLGFSESTELFLADFEANNEMRKVYVSCPISFESPAPMLMVRYNNEEQILEQKKWKELVFDPSYYPSQKDAKKLVNFRLSGIPVGSLSDYYERHWCKIPVQHIGDEWFFNAQGFSLMESAFSLRLKRLVDIVLSLFLLVISAPIILLFYCIVRMTSKGGAIFSQTRVGLNGREFKIFKLRTMKVDAEHNGAKWATEDDPRITKIGDFLRRSRIDELPQCWNVLKGEMSFIGPRPERPEFTQQLAEEIPYYELRHLVKPGLSGWAQVMYPYGASVTDALKKLEYDLYYIKHQSLLLDLNIMLRTVMVVFRQQGR